MTLEAAAIRIIFVLLLTWLAFEAYTAWKQRTRRNRWLSAPERDERDSIQAFRKIVRNG